MGCLHHGDRRVLGFQDGLAERYGLHTVGALVANQPPLRIATGLNDGINIIGYSVEKLLNEYGMVWGDLERWGGRWFNSDTPIPALTRFSAGEVDAIFNEAIMIWPRFLQHKAIRYISVDPAMLEVLHQRYGYLRADLEPGDLPGVEQPVAALDFSQWVIIVRDDLPEEVAYLMTEVIVEDRADFEAKYQHLPLKESALHYPMLPTEMCRVAPLPLHPGSQRYYQEQGILK